MYASHMGGFKDVLTFGSITQKGFTLSQHFRNFLFKTATLCQCRDVFSFSKKLKITRSPYHDVLLPKRATLTSQIKEDKKNKMC